ncbi:hypothetical protein DMENIID0001_061780 [Sergentomyia squamirostris]
MVSGAEGNCESQLWEPWLEEQITLWLKSSSNPHGDIKLNMGIMCFCHEISSSLPFPSASFIKGLEQHAQRGIESYGISCFFSNQAFIGNHEGLYDDD